MYSIFKYNYIILLMYLITIHIYLFNIKLTLRIDFFFTKHKYIGNYVKVLS